MPKTTKPPHWSFERGVRIKGPQDEDFNPASPFVERVRDGNARFICGDHYATGWKEDEEAKRLADDHLRQEHDITVPWLGKPKGAAG